jgi:hypothetical protein
MRLLEVVAVVISFAPEVKEKVAGRPAGKPVEKRPI